MERREEDDQWGEKGHREEKKKQKNAGNKPRERIKKNRERLNGPCKGLPFKKQMRHSARAHAQHSPIKVHILSKHSRLGVYMRSSYGNIPI